MVDAKTEGWIEIAQRGFENWKAKPHNARWFRKIDGTPIPNDLTICIGEAFAEPLRSLTLRVEAEKRAKEEATEDTRSLCRFILSEWGPDGALKATTYSLEQREARSAKGGDANDSGPSRPIDATSPGVTAGASTLEAAETHSAALARALEEAKEALRPFARIAEADIGEDEADEDTFRVMSRQYARAPLLTVGDLRRARSLLAPKEDTDAE